MAVRALTKAFRQLSLRKKEIISSHYSTQATRARTVNVVAARILQVDKPLVKAPEAEHVTFGLRSIGLSYPLPMGELPLRKIIENPFKPSFEIENPLKNNFEKSDIATNKVIETPTNENVMEKKAERMIIIRKKKMKRHKRKKWQKKFKYVLRKRRLRKRHRKEKEFMNELYEMVAKAEAFDAEKYVAERLEILTRRRLPTKWRGEPVSEEMVKQFIKEAEERKAHKRRLHTYRLKLDN